MPTTKVMRISVAAALLAVPFSADGQVLPDAFHGVWKNMEGKTQECSHSDWDSPKHDDTHILVSPKNVTMHEGLCTLKSVKRNPSGAAEVRMSCVGEGDTYGKTEVWWATEVRGVRTLIVANPHDTRSNIQVFQWCPR